MSVFLLHKNTRECKLTSTSVSQRVQKSESAITLIVSPSCVWILGGTEIISPMSSFLIVTISFSGSL
jgi:hypothetical protein